MLKWEEENKRQKEIQDGEVIQQDQWEFEYSIADSVVAAKECLKKIEDEAKLLDLLFLDIGLKGDEDGFALLEYIRNQHKYKERYENTIIYLTTGEDDMRYIMDAYKYGVIKYLKKPIKKTEFNEVMEYIKDNLKEPFKIPWCICIKEVIKSYFYYFLFIIYS